MEQNEGRLDRLRSFVDRDPENVDLAIDYIRTAADEQGSSAALAAVATLSTHVVANPEFANAMGMLLLEAGDPAEAEEFLRTVRAAVRGNPGVNYNLAFALSQQGKFAEALGEMEPVMTEWQQCTPLMLLKARCHHHLEEFDAAADAARQFLDEHPGHLEASGLLSLILSDTGQYAESVQMAREVLDERPEQLEAMLAYANGSIAEGNYAAAGKAMSAAGDRYASVGRLQVLGGQLHLLQAEHDAALEAFRKATEIMPQHIGSWHLLAWCQLLLNDVPAAKNSFESALDIDRNFAESHGGLAVALYLSGDYADAQQAVDLALRLNRHCLSGLYAQSLLDQRSGDESQAGKLIERIFRTSVGQRAEQLMPAIAAHRKANQPPGDDS